MVKPKHLRNPHNYKNILQFIPYLFQTNNSKTEAFENVHLFQIISTQALSSEEHHGLTKLDITEGKLKEHSKKQIIHPQCNSLMLKMSCEGHLSHLEYFNTLNLNKTHKETFSLNGKQDFHYEGNEGHVSCV